MVTWSLQGAYGVAFVFSTYLLMHYRPLERLTFRAVLHTGTPLARESV